MSSSSSRSSRWSASSSGGGGGDGGGGAYDGLGSPVAYRDGPLEYQPERKCFCNVKACQWISWSFRNPGMRYLKCQKARTPQDCHFFRWVDVDYSDSDFFKQLLRDMRDAIWDLRKVVGQKDAELSKQDSDLEAKMKKKDWYIGMLVSMCVFLFVALVATVFKGKLA